MRSWARGLILTLALWASSACLGTARAEGQVQRNSPRVGPDLVVECPTCGQPVRQLARVMLTPGKSRIWSDGWREGYLQTERPWLVECPYCAENFWIDEAEPVRRLASTFEAIEWLEAEDALVPGRTGLQSALDEDELSRDRELYLRQRLWWLTNHRFREVDDLREVEMEDEARRNLEAFAKILDPEVVEERLRLAEIWRELGEFDRALRVLREPLPEMAERVAEFLRQFSRERISAVRPLHE